MIKVDNSRVKIVYGLILWVLAIIYATTIMIIIGVDFDEPDFEFGPDHDKYWTFELIMIPSFLLIGSLFVYRYLSKIALSKGNWLDETVSWGLIVMMIQFLMDLIVLVILAGSGLDYFLAMVTLSYLFIPLNAYIVGWYRFRQNQ